MALKIKVAQRVFKMDDDGEETILPDPGESMSPNEVRKFHAAKHPALTNASITGPVMENDKAVYTFGVQVGEKG